MSEIQTTANGEKVNIPQLEQFTSRLNALPSSSETKINIKANNSVYLPISFVQMTLDEMFLGMWNWEFKSYQVVANEIIGTGILEVYHPITKVWIKRSGAGAIMIQQKSGSDITDIGAKFKNTLVKDFPHLESECLKSAAKKLGKVFGRDLNREFNDNYNPIYTHESELADDIQEITRKLNNCTTTDDLTTLWGTYKEQQGNTALVRLFNARKQQILRKK